MTTHYSSKHGRIARGQAELYMVFCDMRNFSRFLPENADAKLNSDYDNLSITLHGFTIAVKVVERKPYNLIRIASADSPVEFTASLHFDATESEFKTDFYIELEANLNLMMRSFLGPKVQKGLDKIVDSLVEISEGRMPEGFGQ